MARARELTEAQDACFQVLQRLCSAGQADVARAWIARHRESRDERGRPLLDAIPSQLLAALARAEVSRPPGVYVPIVYRPPGLEPGDDELSVAFLVRVGPVGEDEALAPDQHELDAEARRRFAEATGHRLARRLGLGDRDFRRALPTGDLRSAEAGMWLQAVLDLERRLSPRMDGREALDTRGRRVLVTGNLMDAELPEGRDVRVARVDAATLPVKLRDAKEVLGDDVLVVVPAENAAELEAPGLVVVGVSTVSELVRAATGAELRRLPPWAIRERAMALGERLIYGRPDQRAIERVARVSEELSDACYSNETAAMASLHAVQALTCLRRGRVDEARELLELYVAADRVRPPDGVPGAEEWGRLENLYARVLDLRNGFASGLKRLSDLRDAVHVPAREDYLLAGTEALLCAHRMDELRVAGERVREPARLEAALRTLRGYAHRDPWSVAYYEGRAAVAREDWDAAEAALAPAVRPAVPDGVAADPAISVVSCLRAWAMMRRRRGQQEELLREVAAWRATRDPRRHPTWALVLKGQELLALLERERLEEARDLLERIGRLAGDHPSDLHAMHLAVARLALRAHELGRGQAPAGWLDEVRADLGTAGDYHVAESLIRRRAAEALAALAGGGDGATLADRLTGVVAAQID